MPPFGKMYNLSKEEQDQLNLYVEENLKKGLIKVLSYSAAAPKFNVKVPDKAERMNIWDSYPLPVISLLLKNLQGCKYLSKIDLNAEFSLLRVAPGHEWKT